MNQLLLLLAMSSQTKEVPRNVRRYLVITLALLALAAASLPAQTTLGTLRGLVTDQTGAAVPGVSVVVRNVDTNIQNQTVTNESGLYEITHLLPGRYSATAELPGFKTLVVSNILLETSATVRVDFRLEVGEVTTSVNVEAAATGINTEGAEVNTIRTNEMVQETPVPYRGGSGQGYVYFTMVLAPGAQRAQGSNFSFAGVRGHQWTASTDGINIRSVVATSQPTMDDTQELRIQLANEKAESHAPGGIHMLSKSGGNEYHGTLYYYHSNPVINARNTFSSERGFTLTHNYGMTVGGPVIKDRTFFFANYERYQERANRNFNLNVPTEAFRRGDFSSLSNQTQIVDPMTSEPFPENIIPLDRISPVSQKVQDFFYPLPNFGPPDNFQRNWRGVIPRLADRHQIGVRVDHRFSSSNSMYVRVIWNRAIRDFEPALPTLPRSENDRRGTTIAISNTHIFTPTLINEFRFGIGRSENPEKTPSMIGLELARQFGLEGIAENPVVPYGAPSFSITDFASTPTSLFFDSRDSTTEFVNNVSWVRGSHTLKTGVNIRLNNNNDFPGGSSFIGRSFGNFSFTHRFSNFSYADFLLGIPQRARRSNTAPRFNLVNTDFSLFVQDDWKVTRRLTLNLGLRYDVSPPSHERNDLFFNFDPDTAQVVVPNEGAKNAVNPLFPSDLIPVVTASEVSLPETLYFSDLNNFAPRLGFAFRPFADSTTVIRGGYGVYTTFRTPRLYRDAVGGPFVSDERFTNSVVNGVPEFQFPRAFPAGFGAIGAQSFTAVDPRLRNPTLHQWSLTVEREIADNILRISYIGDHSSGLVWEQDLNQPPPGPEAFSSSMRRFPRLSGAGLLQNGGNHDYHSLHVVAERRMKSGLAYQLGWTWAKNITDVHSDSESGGQPENSFARHLERADANFMPRHRVVGTFLYDLPFGSGRSWLSDLTGVSKTLLSDWRLTANLVTQTGLYFTPTFSGFDVSNTDTIGGRPDRIADGNLPASERTLERWFDVSAFRVPGDLDGDGRPEENVGRFGNSAPNVLVGPGRFYINLGLFKEFSIGERAKATLSGVFTNVLNHPNYGNPNSNISAGSVGQVRSTAARELGTERQGLLGLRIEF